MVRTIVMSAPVDARAVAAESSRPSTGFELPGLTGVPGVPGAVGWPGFVTVAASTLPHPALPLPNRPTPLPHTMTGAVTGAAMPEPDEVDEVDDPAVELPVGQPDDGSAPMPTLFPQTVAGAVTGA